MSAYNTMEFIIFILILCQPISDYCKHLYSHHLWFLVAISIIPELVSIVLLDENTSQSIQQSYYLQKTLYYSLRFLLKQLHELHGLLLATLTVEQYHHKKTLISNPTPVYADIPLLQPTLRSLPYWNLYNYNFFMLFLTQHTSIHRLCQRPTIESYLSEYLLSLYMASYGPVLM